MENKLTYSRNGDYLIPNLTLEDQPSQSLGKYGRMRRKYLREHRPALWAELTVSGKLFSHLLEIERTASERLDRMMPELARSAGVTESMKASDPMKWTGLMNTCKAQAEEMIQAELIYS